VYDFDEGEEGGIALVSTTTWVRVTVYHQYEAGVRGQIQHLHYE
jgi:hypothetical protein